MCRSGPGPVSIANKIGLGFKPTLQRVYLHVRLFSVAAKEVRVSSLFLLQPRIQSLCVMRRCFSLSSTLAALVVATTTHAQTLSNVTTPSLNLTTITAHDGRSAYECWQIPGFAASTTAGISGALNLFLGDAANVSLTVLPPRFNGGAHTAPAPQYVHEWVWFPS